LNRATLAKNAFYVNMPDGLISCERQKGPARLCPGPCRGATRGGLLLFLVLRNHIPLSSQLNQKEFDFEREGKLREGGDKGESW